MLRVSIAMLGYTEGGTQVREAEERKSRSIWAVGRTEIDSLQHNSINSQSALEKPNDSVSRRAGRSHVDRFRPVKWGAKRGFVEHAKGLTREKAYRTLFVRCRYRYK